MRYEANPLSGTPAVVKNLLIINGLVFLYTALDPFKGDGMRAETMFGLHFITSPLFKPWQLLTYMFMHGNLPHILLNMLGLFMLGPRVEYRWGSKRFLSYYILCGFGAAVLYIGWLWFGAREALMGLDADTLASIHGTVLQGEEEGMRYVYKDPTVQTVYGLLSTTMVGASGALFGVMTAFGMLYPNVELMMLMFPVPIKAKWFVLIYAAIELFSGVANIAGDNVAHFAHLGGMVAGFFLVKAFERRNTFYDQHW